MADRVPLIAYCDKPECMFAWDMDMEPYPEACPHADYVPEGGGIVPSWDDLPKGVRPYWSEVHGSGER